jgi:hypothetical protein
VAVFGLVLNSVWGGAVALAMHDVDHRFTVAGYVRDGQSRPVVDARVIVSAARAGEGITAFTDHRGYYEAVLHLHDTDLGEAVTVTTGDQSRQVTAQFDPQDKHSERRVAVDFGSTSPPAVPQQGGDDAIWWGGGALITAVIGIAIAMYVRKSRAAHGAGKPSSKKKRGS